MKSFLKHICSVALAFLVLFSTFSFTINEHVCGGVKMSFAIGVEADNCGMEMETNTTEETTMQQKSCCDDVSTLIQGQDELPSKQELDIATITFLKAFVYSYIFILPATDEEKALYKPYVPPPLIRDIQVLHETYLI